MTPAAYAEQVRRHRVALKQARARSEQELYGPGPRLTPAERRRARQVERAITDREAQMARTPQLRRFDRPDMFARAMRRRVRRPTPSQAALQAERDREAYYAMQGEDEKAFRAPKLPRMPKVDAAGISTRPWGARRIRGIGLSGPSGPSQRALDAWQRATGTKPSNPGQILRQRRRRVRLFGGA